jgi:hypothetical protein
MGSVHLAIAGARGQLGGHRLQVRRRPVRREDAREQACFPKEISPGLWGEGVDQRLVEVEDLASLREPLIFTYSSHWRRLTPLRETGSRSCDG